MNLWSDNTKETESLNSYSKCLYVGGGGCLNQRDNEQNADNDHLYSGRLKSRTLFIIPSNTAFEEPRNYSSRVSSQTACSQYLHSESEYPPNVSYNRKPEYKQNLSGNFFQEKYGIQTKCAYTNSYDRVKENLPGRVHEKKYSDKTTYCRPVVNLYNQEFLFKTMVKNAKLRRLVTELTIARQKEKEVENWNNYINDLKKKHYGEANITLATSLRYISENCEAVDTIEDIYNTKFACKQSDRCQSLLEDMYNEHHARITYNNSTISHKYSQTPRSYNPFKTNFLCFPTSSQGRLIMLERERTNRLENRGYKPVFKTINEEKKLESEGLSRKGLICGPKINFVSRHTRGTNTTMEFTSTQTEIQMMPSKSVEILKSKGCNTNHIAREKEFVKDVRNKGTEPVTFCYPCSDLKKNCSLVCIEEKLDDLIHSVNNFMNEMKTKRARHKHLEQHTKPRKRNVNYTRSDICNVARKEKNICGLIDDSSRTTRNSSIDNISRNETIDERLTKINDILLKGVGKKQLITLKGSSVGNAYPCSVQISVTIPTREISTEVTRSLSKAAYVGDKNKIKEIPRSEDRRIAIAVNTDPFSILAMLKASTAETIRRLLSYVPTIDYYSYLSRLQGPPLRLIESQYICNICGAAFIKPSSLTDHIQKHELGNTRDCCVCRQVLDLPRRLPNLFKCQYCGQRFTRAYCCELHQEGCARRLGKLHDVPSSLVLLR